MDQMSDFYAANPYWVWLALGVILLAIETAFSTEWLLWPAVSAGVVAVLTAVGVRLGFGIEVVIFAVLTIAFTLLSRRLITRVNPTDTPDINARDSRLLGQRAQVIQDFVDGRGRVFVSGAEWPADLEGATPEVGTSVIVERVNGPRLTVRAA